MLKFIKKNNVLILVFLIFCLALLLRVYRLPQIYVFNFDEEYQATYAWTLVKHLHRIWIGVSASFLDFYLGPYFTYFTGFLLGISKGDPLLTAYFAAVFGAFISVIIFFIGWKFFNLTTGVVSSFLYATLPLFVFFDQKYWNPMFNLLIILLMFVTLNLIRKSKWWWLFYAALVGAIFETDLAPAPFVLIGVFYFLKGKYWKDFKLIFLCVIIFMLFYWPLLIFDYYHNFSNLTVFSRFGQQAKQSKASFDPLVKFHSLFDSMGRFWYLKPGNPNTDEINLSCSVLSIRPELRFIGQYAKRTYGSPVLSLASLIILGYFLWTSVKGNNNFPQKLLAVFLLISALFYLIYPGGSFEYYTLGFFVLFVFTPGIIISRFNKSFKIIFLPFIIIAALFGINTILKASDEFSLGPKKILITQLMKQIRNEPFSIEARGICHDFEGWRYLFKVYGRTPVQSDTDKNFAWLYPEEVSNEKPIYTIILSEDRIPLKEDLSKVPSIKVGGYRAYIRKNI